MSSIAFDRSGRRLIVIDPDAIAVTELAGGSTTRLAIPDARAIAGFDDQLWVVGGDDKLVRLAYDGAPIGEPVQLPFSARAGLAVAPCGPPAAVWGALPHVAVREEDAVLVRAEIAGDADAVLPLTGRRWIVARHARLTLPTGVAVALPPSTAVLGGAVTADGKTCVVLAGRGADRELLVVGLGTGQIALRLPVPRGLIRIAAARAIAVTYTAGELLAVDLRTGHPILAVALAGAVTDLAVDPDGTRIATRAGCEIEVHEIAALAARPARGRPEPAVAEAPPIEAEVEAVAEPTPPAKRPEPVPAPPAPARGPLVVPVLHALEPRAPIGEPDRAEARRQLDLELRRVELCTLAAIADAWNTRRLGYGNEGKHPFELEVAALLGLNDGFAAEHVAAARDLLADHERTLAADPAWRAADSPVGVLRAELGLDDRALDVLIVIAAAALRGETARLYGILSNDPHRAIVDELLVQQVLARRHDRRDVALELDARAPLLRLGIVQHAGARARPFTELALDPVILDRLRGVAPALGLATTVRDAGCPLDALDVPRPTLEATLAALAHATSEPARLVVVGRVGSGRRTLLSALAAAAGRRLAVIDCSALPRRAELFVAELARSLRQAQLTGCLPCVLYLDEVTFDASAGRDVAAEPLRLHPGPIALVASPDTPVPFPPGHVEVVLPVLSEGERRAVWEAAMHATGVPVTDVDRLAARYKIGPGVIRRAVAAAARTDGDPIVASEAYIRQTRDARLGQHARRVERLASWASVVLPPDILDSLRELIARVRHGHTVYETWGMHRALATSRGLTALFQGLPGTGKTLVAGVIARELGLDLYQVDLSKVMSKWIGETERNLSTIFDAAEDGQVVLLFDEADSLFAKRTEVRSSNDRYANLEVNYLLQRLDAFEGIAILTTNSGGSIDQAFKRRMSFRLSFPFPDEETRQELWRAHLPPELPIAGRLALDALARKYQLSGGYIRNACVRAAFLAAQEESPLHQRHLERAVALELTDLGKLSSGGVIA